MTDLPEPLGLAANKFVEAFQQREKMTHASIALVAAAIISNGLQTALTKRMRPLNSYMTKRVFDAYGPLNNFAARADLSYALGIISEQTYQNIRVLNKIRVAFAHSPALKNFSDPDVQSLLQSFQPYLADGVLTASHVLLAQVKQIEDSIESAE